MTSKKPTLYQCYTSGNPPIVVADIDFDNNISHVSRSGDRVTVVFDPSGPSTYEISGHADEMRRLCKQLCEICGEDA